MNLIKGSLISRLLKDSTWSMIATFSNKVSLVVVGIIISRLLGVENFGKFAIIQSVVIMLANVVAQSITTATSKHIAEFLKTDVVKVSRGIAITLLFSLFFALVIVVFSSIYASSFAKYLLLHEELSQYVKTTVYIIVLTVLLGWIQGVFSGLGKFRINAIINAIISIVTVALAFVMTKDYGFDGAIYSFISSQAIAVIVSVLFIFRCIKEKNVKIIFKNCFTETSVITHVGLPILLTGLIVAPVTWFSNKLLSALVDGLQQLAMFSASMQWSAIFTQASVVLGTVLIPLLASKKNEKNSQLEKINFYSSWIFTVICTIPILLFSDVFIRIYGHFDNAIQFSLCISFVLFGAILTSFKSGIARKIVILNLSWFSVISNISWATIFVVFALCSKKYGAIGITGALFFSQLLHFLVTTPYFIKRKIIDYKLILNFKVLLISIAPIIALLIRLYIDNGIIRIISLPILLVVTLFLSFKLFKSNQ
ncbi:oligosaccharide flippase family protein [Erwinia sp. JUb26]|uniref:oligosaccharide flippase family protein n=1 Tax=Erwinia sp. JUb26 TaxID=2485126 RepID=UPI000F49F9B3|nr:oligosaccharide flippase family protein [Erwinia sp. JUb26]ROR07728.1 Na+-driven multidrug efflux pump [Erwinia sp. JUb26]